jgi:hypothetical protein
MPPTPKTCYTCNTTITQKEHAYSIKNYKKPLCRKHQLSKPNNNNPPPKPTKNKPNNNNNPPPNSPNTGLSTREGYYKEGMIKGRIAETLIEELFLSLKYNVFRYGMENTVPGIMKLLKGVRSDVASNIRRMPDFVIQSNSGENKGEVYFIEVKFRANEEFSIKDLPENYPYTNAYFVVVSKKHIKCISYKELTERKIVSPKSQNYLGSRKEFELDKKVIIDFCNFAVKFFENV